MSSHLRQEVADALHLPEGRLGVASTVWGLGDEIRIGMQVWDGTRWQTLPDPLPHPFHDAADPLMQPIWLDDEPPCLPTGTLPH